MYKRGLIGKFSSNRFLLACLLYHNLKSYNANQAATATKAAKKTIGLISNKTSLHVQHTFLYISLPLFCTTTTFQKLPSYTFHGGNVVCGPVHSFFAAADFYLGGASISHFLTAAVKFSFYSSNEIGPLCFSIFCSSSFSVIHANVDLNN